MSAEDNGRGPDTIPPAADEMRDWRNVEPPSEPEWARLMYRGLLCVDGVVSQVAESQASAVKVASQRHEQLEAMFFEFIGKARSAEEQARTARGLYGAVAQEHRALSETVDHLTQQQKGDLEAIKTEHAKMNARISLAESKADETGKHFTARALKKAEQLDSLTEEAIKRKLGGRSDPPGGSEPPHITSKWRPRSRKDWARLAVMAVLSMGSIAAAVSQAVAAFGGH